MKISYAKQLEIDIAKATDHLARLIQEASTQGMSVSFELAPFRHISGQAFDVPVSKCEINPSKLESD